MKKISQVIISMKSNFYKFIQKIKSFLKSKAVPLFEQSNMGIFLNLWGSLIIAFTVITSDPEAASSAFGGWGGTPSSYVYFQTLLLTYESTLGLILLALGFVLQIKGLPKFSNKLLSIVAVFCLVVPFASYGSFKRCAARETLKVFIENICDTNISLRSIAIDLKKAGVDNNKIDDILNVDQMYLKIESDDRCALLPIERSNKEEIEFKKEEWKHIKELAEEWRIKIKPDNPLEIAWKNR